jgi:hypothetical protein
MSYLKSIKKRFSFDADKLKINWLKNLSKDLNTKNHGLKQFAWSQLLMGSVLTYSKEYLSLVKCYYGKITFQHLFLIKKRFTDYKYLINH